MWKDQDVPVEYTSYINSWKNHNPGWKYYFWTDEMLDDFIYKKYNWFYKKYSSYELNIMRSDAARLFLLHHFGGLYVDIDIECLKPIDTLIDSDCIMFYEYPERDLHSQLNCENIITNSILYCNKKYDTMKSIIKHLLLPVRKTNNINLDVIYNTGPVFLTTAVDKLQCKDNITFKSNNHFEKYSKNKRHDLLRNNSSYETSRDMYGIHWNVGSWIVGESKFKYKI